MKNKLLLAMGIVLVLIAAAFLVSRYLVSRLDGTGPRPATSTADQLPEQVVEWKTYASPSAGLQFQYPPQLRLLEGGADAGWRTGTQDPGTLIATVSLPENFQPNTNLSDGHIRFGMSADPKAVADCYASGVNAGKVSTGTPVTINSIPFLFFRESDAGAGNFYDTSSYRTKRNGRCYAVEVTVHSTNLENYPEEQQRTRFDNAKVQSLLLGVFQTLKFL
jgi:hypothetical protein